MFLFDKSCYLVFWCSRKLKRCIWYIRKSRNVLEVCVYRDASDHKRTEMSTQVWQMPLSLLSQCARKLFRNHRTSLLIRFLPVKFTLYHILTKLYSSILTMLQSIMASLARLLISRLLLILFMKLTYIFSPILTVFLKLTYIFCLQYTEMKITLP